MIVSSIKCHMAEGTNQTQTRRLDMFADLGERIFGDDTRIGRAMDGLLERACKVGDRVLPQVNMLDPLADMGEAVFERFPKHVADWFRRHSGSANSLLLLAVLSTSPLYNTNNPNPQYFSDSNPYQTYNSTEVYRG
jgi:hypothetical protein